MHLLVQGTFSQLFQKTWRRVSDVGTMLAWEEKQ